MRLDVSLVTYRPDPGLLAATLAGLSAAARALEGGTRLFLVDNGPGDNRALLEGLAAAHLGAHVAVEVLHGHGNVGYGRGHDLALMERGDAPCHLVLNPDVVMRPDALRLGLAFLAAEPAAVMVAPRVETPAGAFEPSCKRYPDLATLALRGFAPAALRRLFRRRLDHYEMRDVITPDTAAPVRGVPIASGCFMLLRAEAARRAGGFGSAYFLYFEDFDLCLRLGRAGEIVYVPWVRITHHGGNAARKGWRHVRLFATSAVTFFRRNG